MAAIRSLKSIICAVQQLYSRECWLSAFAVQAKRIMQSTKQGISILLFKVQNIHTSFKNYHTTPGSNH